MLDYKCSLDLLRIILAFGKSSVCVNIMYDRSVSQIKQRRTSAFIIAILNTVTLGM